MNRLLPDEAPAWAEQLAQLVASVQPTGGVRPVLTLQEAMALTGCASSSAFYRWMKTWAPRACCGHGRYAFCARRWIGKRSHVDAAAASTSQTGDRGQFHSRSAREGGVIAVSKGDHSQRKTTKRSLGVVSPYRFGRSAQNFSASAFGVSPR